MSETCVLWLKEIERMKVEPITCLPLAKRARVVAKKKKKKGPAIAYFLNTY